MVNSDIGFNETKKVTNQSTYSEYIRSNKHILTLCVICNIPKFYEIKYKTNTTIMYQINLAV